MENKRMLKYFLEMVAIPSPSKSEGEIYNYLIDKLKAFGLEVETDNAGEKVGSDANNIYAILKGDKNLPGIILSAHMDTVIPAKSQKPFIEDTLIKSDGKSVLGSDDKAAIAIIFEILHRIKEEKIPHGDIEVVITISEEIGLLGAKEFDISRFKNNEMLIFDMGGINEIAYASIGQKNYKLKIKGKSAHAGLEPEKGINAIVIASEIISKLPNGKIDFNTTANIGLISGGKATNIIPDEVEILGEVRSHDLKKLDFYIDKIIQTAWEIIRKYSITVSNVNYYPELEYEIKERYLPVSVEKNIPLIKDLLKAGDNLNREQKLVRCNGGNDGNVFVAKGISAVNIAMGMNNIHSVNESIDYRDMEDTVELVLEFLKVRGK